MKGKEGTGDAGGPDAKSGRYSCGEKCFFADVCVNPEECEVILRNNHA